MLSRILNWLRASPGSPGRRETHFVQHIHFLSAQAGPIEREFALRLQPILSGAQEITAALLCRVHYGDPRDISVALCLRCLKDELDPALVHDIHAVFVGLFAQGQSLDILPLNDIQERGARSVATTLYERSSEP